MKPMSNTKYMKKKNKLIQKHFNTDLELVPEDQIEECEKHFLKVSISKAACLYCQIYWYPACKDCPMDKAGNGCIRQLNSTYDQYILLKPNNNKEYMAALAKLINKYNISNNLKE